MNYLLFIRIISGEKLELERNQKNEKRTGHLFYKQLDLLFSQQC